MWRTKWSIVLNIASDSFLVLDFSFCPLPSSFLSFRWLLQQPSFPDAPQPQSQDQDTVLRSTPQRTGSQYEQHHILWVIPNYRTDENPSTIEPLTPGQKFKLAFDDSFDPSAFLVAGFFGGISMAEDQH